VGLSAPTSAAGVGGVAVIVGGLVLAGEQVSSDPIDCSVDLGLLVVGPLVVGTIASAFG